MLNLPIHPTFMSVKADSSKVFVGIGGQPNLRPFLRVQPFLHQTQELPPDAPSLVFPEYGDHPHFTGRLWYGSPNAISTAIDYAKHRGRSHDGVIRVYDSAGNVIETHKHAGDFTEW
jgi:hypothetical protein